MDGNRFDFIVKTLIAHAPRREAIKALAGGGLAAVAVRFSADETDARKKKRRCRKRRQTCGKKKCCGQKSGLVACREFPTATCTTLSGRHCCGLEGAVCSNDLDINNCDCCDGLFCGGVPGQEGRCTEEPS
jgi:hypothetical protein